MAIKRQRPASSGRMWQRTVKIVRGLSMAAAALQFASPKLIRAVLNRKLRDVPGASGEVRIVELNLWRGYIALRDLTFAISRENVSLRFSCRTLEVSLTWAALFTGAALARIVLQSPQLTVRVTGEEKEDKKHRSTDLAEFSRKMRAFFPFCVKELEIRNGRIDFQTTHTTPPVSLALFQISGRAQGLTNIPDAREKLPGSLAISGQTTGHGRLAIQLVFSALSEALAFKLQGELVGVNMVGLNDFLRAYGKFDVKRGTCSIYTEVAAANGRYEGYFKPLFEDLDVFAWEKDHGKNLWQLCRQAVVSAVAGLFKNQARDRLALKVPLSGTFDKTDVDVWSAVGSLLKNAFVRSLLPNFDRSVSIARVEKTAAAAA